MAFSFSSSFSPPSLSLGGLYVQISIGRRESPAEKRNSGVGTLQPPPSLTLTNCAGKERGFFYSNFRKICPAIGGNPKVSCTSFFPPLRYGSFETRDGGEECHIVFIVKYTFGKACVYGPFWNGEKGGDRECATGRKMKFERKLKI